ncbi:MAG: DEAD/DEAH box helicase [Saprospiraceae bacterium]|nr:DEAD/DEAH box helicase [Saprospiraceae bacterium]MCF8252209.1 DEAD/DEAH box helicase [Saprospiraceae bacterium]MCF8282007.1 DEAD/DEAH box helicase [Bacteroidales bacterium]MCF8311665.1 DEAD/DEAH box helicase [Saprospiraceae bacterium]MCF8442584.1 DEAD/DEAH box helicase [Saprospiraceae bacterium]
MKFADLGLAPTLLEGLDAMGFENATPIQEQAIPALLNGQDVLACAQTGTGKTAAFLLPILNRLISDPIAGIDTIILEPTRELAVQVDQQLEGFSYFTPVSSVAIYGGRDGHSMEMEMRALKKGVDVVVATPGRFLAHLQMGYVNLDTVRHLVLDEADRMLDMGFVQDIMTIVNKIPRARQTFLFSATMPNEIRKFSQSLLRNPLEISIAISKPAAGITQGVFFVEDEKKNRLIEMLLRNEDPKKRVLIFAGTKRAVKELNNHLKNKGFKSNDIHSDLEQQQREDTLLTFKNATVPILVATDVLSRGIDIKGIEIVINFDVPSDPEDYVHRIGRTARADALGAAYTLVGRMGRKKFMRIEQLMELKVKVLPLPEGLESGGGSSEHRGGRGGGGGGRPPRGGGHSSGGQRRGGGRSTGGEHRPPRGPQPPRAEGDGGNAEGGERRKSRNRGGRNRGRGRGGNSGEGGSGQAPATTPPAPPAA